MTRKFVTHLGFLIFVNLLVKPFWIFGIDRVVQNQVGAEEYGIYFSLYNFSVLLYVLLDFGISNFNNREVSYNQKSLMENLGSMFVLKLILSGVYLFVTLGAAFLIGYSGMQLYWLLILSMGQIFLSFLLFFRSGMSGLQAFNEDAILSVSDRLLMILLVGSLLLFFAGEFQIDYLIYVQTLTWGITALIAFVWLLYKAGTIEWNWESKSILPLLRSTVPFALVGLLMSIYSRIDGVMIERLLGNNGAEEAGIYAASFRLLDAVNMFAYLFASLLLPMFSKILSKEESVLPLLSLSTRILLTLAMLLGIGSYVFGTEIMSMLYPVANQYYADVFTILMFSFFGTAMMYVFGTLLLAAKNLKWLNIIAFTGMLVNVILNLIYIPEYGAYGAAGATLFTQALVAIAQTILVAFQFKVKVKWYYILQIVVFVSASIFIALQIDNLEINWLYQALIWLTVSLLIGFLIRLLPGMSQLKKFTKLK